MAVETDRTLIETTKARELAVTRAADCTLVCNRVEQEILEREAPDAFCRYLPWVIEARNGPLPGFAERKDIMLLEGCRHPPNLDAVQWFVRAVMPAPRHLVADIRLHVYGSAIPEVLQEVACEHGVIGGHVADVATVFDRHRVNVVPLRYGAGFKGKLASSLASGVPSVAPPVGAEGTGLCRAENVLVAGDAVGFAAAVACLYTDEALWRRIAEAGPRYAREHLSPERARGHFQEIFHRLHPSLSPGT